MPLLNYAGSRPDGSCTLRSGETAVGSNFGGQSSFATHALAYERNVVVVPDGDLPSEAAEVARIVRQSRAVTVDYEVRGLAKKMGAADKVGASWAVIFDGEDARRRVARVRNMKTGEQAEVSWQELPERLA